MASTLAEVTESNRNGAEKPCRNALRLDAILPARVLGPVLRLALARLAAICFSLAISDRSASSLFDHLGGRLSRTASLGIFSCKTTVVLFLKHTQRGLAVGFHTVEH